MEKLMNILTDESKSFEAPGWVFAVGMLVFLLLGLAGWMDMHGM